MVVTVLIIGIPLLNATRFVLDRLHQKSSGNSFIEKPFDFLLIDQYKFFSPNIADGYILLIETIPEGKIIPMRVNNRELINRLQNVYHRAATQNGTAAALMHSLAVYILTNYPDTRAIDLKLLRYKLPKISEYASDKISYELIFENTYNY